MKRHVVPHKITREVMKKKGAWEKACPDAVIGFRPSFTVQKARRNSGGSRFKGK